MTCLLLLGCGGAASPAEKPDQYAQLVRVATAEMRVEEDTTRLWLRNAEAAQIRDLMLDLGLDYVRYDAAQGVMCAWAGGGMRPARGYVYRIPVSARLPRSTARDGAPSDSASRTVGARDSVRHALPADSLGEVCYRSGRCTEAAVTDDWTRFECP